jgi:hypothetical protein
MARDVSKTARPQAKKCTMSGAMQKAPEGRDFGKRKPFVYVFNSQKTACQNSK